MASENQATRSDDAVIDELLSGSDIENTVTGEVVAPDEFATRQWVPGKCVQCGKDLNDDRVCEDCGYDEKNKSF